MSLASISRAHVDVELAPYALPADSILAGDPRPMGHVICDVESGGGRLVTGVYACSPGTILATATATETIHVLDGEATLELSSGERLDVGPGDVAVLPAGVVVTWTFHSAF